MTLQPGTRLGPYEIERLLGEGAMGVVYKARDVRLKRHDLIPGQSRVHLSSARGLGGGPEILFYIFSDRTTSTVLRVSRAVGLGLSLAPDESWFLFFYQTALVLT